MLWDLTRETPKHRIFTTPRDSTETVIQLTAIVSNQHFQPWEYYIQATKFKHKLNQKEIQTQTTSKSSTKTTDDHNSAVKESRAPTSQRLVSTMLKTGGSSDNAWRLTSGDPRSGVLSNSYYDGPTSLVDHSLPHITSIWLVTVSRPLNSGRLPTGCLGQAGVTSNSAASQTQVLTTRVISSHSTGSYQ